MLQFNDKIWKINCSDLRNAGIRAPQGFSFSFSTPGSQENFMWTTDEFNAYLFAKRHNNLISDEIRQYFKKSRDTENYLFKLSFATDSGYEFSAPDGMAYRAYQNAAIEYALAVNNLLIADEQRLGKTPTTIGVINNSDIKKVLIVCPKTVKSVWHKELNVWLMKPLKIQVVDAGSRIDDCADIYIINYDILHIQTFLQKIDFDLIVADECHLISHTDARRTKFFLNLRGKKIIGLSGTPLLNQPNDLLSIAKWLDPFWSKFRVVKDKIISDSGVSLELDEVQDLLRSSIMVRRIQAQVFEKEPSEVNIIPLPVPEYLRPVIDAPLYSLEDYVKVRKALGIAKIPYAVKHLKTYSSEGEKIVVFAYHNEVIERLVSSFGRKAVGLYGKSSDRERAHAIKEFQTNKDCSLLIGSIGAASMGLNLSVSNHIVFVEVDWSAGMMSQAGERCSDKTQKRQVLVDFLIFQNSLDSKILDNLRKKSERIDLGLDVLYV